VSGWNDASETFNVTLELVLRGAEMSLPPERQRLLVAVALAHFWTRQFLISAT